MITQNKTLKNAHGGAQHNNKNKCKSIIRILKNSKMKKRIKKK